MSAIASEYLPVLLFFAVGIAFALIFVSAPIAVSGLIGTSKPEAVKLSEYESGFPAFSDARTKFDVQFYLVAILFIVFDLEIAFLFPWAVALDSIGTFGLLSMGIFLAILIVGFVYEWKKGALEWD
jgi:NADH-quinone oxidoreductase subunit A